MRDGQVIAYGQTDAVPINDTSKYYTGYTIVQGPSSTSPYYDTLGVKPVSTSCTVNKGTCKITSDQSNNNFVISIDPAPPAPGPSPTAGLAFSNTTSYYLNAGNQDIMFYADADLQTPLAKQQVTPSQLVYVKPGSYVGIVPCSSQHYTADSGCVERENGSPAIGVDGAKGTQGGYATYLALSVANHTCTIPNTSARWTCDWDTTSGKFSLNFKPNVDTAAQTVFNSSLKNNIPSYTDLPFRGINISGLEYDGTYLDGLFQLPGLPEMVYFTNEGMNTVRVPIRAEFWLVNKDTATQSTYDGLATAVPNYDYVRAVHDLVQQYLDQGLTVILDLHNYMRFCDTTPELGQTNEPTNSTVGDPAQGDHVGPNYPACHVMTEAQLTQIWQSVMTSKAADGVDQSFADIAKTAPQHLIFGIMNEPYSQAASKYSPTGPSQIIPTGTVFTNEIAAAQAIRASGATNNLILLSGNYWDPMHGFVHGTTDAQAMGLKGNGDTYVANKDAIGHLGNTAFEVHQYVDSNFSGTKPTCNLYTDYQAFKNDIEADDFATWFKANNVKIFLGEFGAAGISAGTGTNCEVDLHYLIRFVNENKTTLAPGQGGFIGWSLWRGNARLKPNAGFGWFNALQSSLDGVFYAGYTDQGKNLYGIQTGAANPYMGSLFCKKATDDGDYGYLTPVNEPSSTLPTDCSGY